jgi:outer membrane protein, heavy metal efflux system
MISLNLRANGAKSLRWRIASLALSVAVCSLPALAEPLPLSVAMTRAVASDPIIVATQQRVTAATASVRQASVRPNPNLGIEVENALGSGPYSGIDRAETTLSYQQAYERGGKRTARIGAASAQRDLIAAQGRLRSWNVIWEVHKLWIEATVAEADAILAADRLKLAKDAQAEIGRRVDAARDPLFAGSLADSDVASSQIALDQAIAKARQLKLELASFWNGGADFELDPAWLNDVSAASATPALIETPDVGVLRAQQRLAAAEIKVETSRRTQDPTLQAGIRHFKADDAFAFVVGGSIPLGRFNTNQGAIERSQAEALAASTDIEAAERIRSREIAASSIRLSNAATEVRRIDAEVLPQAERAVNQVREGFARGGFTYRDVMGAQEALMKVKARRLEVLKQFHLEQATRERLSGKWAALLPEVGTAQ